MARPKRKTGNSGECDVFLSHNSKNKPVVIKLANELKKRGLKVWLDEWELIPGRPWQEALEEIIQTTRTAAVLVGKDGMGPWEKPEMRASLSEFVDRKLPVIPVLLPEAPKKPQLPLFLRLFTWVDLRKGLTKEGLDRLEWGIRGKRPHVKVAAKAAKQDNINNIPFVSLGNLFKGRVDVLDNLKKRLAKNKATAITQTIQGLGGIGKTRLAVEFSWWAVRNKKYRAVLFVSSESPELINSSLASLAKEDILDLPGEKEDEQVASVLCWLNDNDNWLLVFDNADSEDSAVAVEDLLPRLAAGHVIITSRYKRWSGSVEPQSLGLLEALEAKQFLLDRTKGRRIKTKVDEEIAAQLAEKLGCLPLALEQAGAFIANSQSSLKEYAEQWDTDRENVLTWFDERLMKYPASVAVTWQRTFDRLDVPAKAILNISSHLAPELIPEQMFEDGADILKEAIKLLKKDKAKSPSKLKIKDAIAQLAAYSMVTRQQDGFTVHRLVQQVIRSRIPKARRKKWLEMALRIVNNHAPEDSDDVRTWSVMDVLRPHAELIAQSVDKAKITNPTSRLMSVIGNYLHSKGLYNQAERWSRRALTIDEASFGPDHPKISIHLNNLAELLRETGHFKEAEPMFRRALKIDEASFGPDHPDVAVDLNNLGQLLVDTNRIAEGKPLMRRALKIDEASFGPDHPNVACDLNNLAELLRETGRFKEAEPIYRRALKIDEASLGPDHPKVAIRLNNLALLLQATNHLAEAELMCRRALKIDEASFDPDHPSVAIVLNNLADLLGETGRFKDAEPLYRRALKIWEKSLGPNHPNVANAINNLALLLQETDRLDEAEPMIRRALKIDETSFGPDHPNVAIRLNNLALLLKATNRLVEAEPMMRRALKILEASYGPDHSSTITVRNNLEGLKRQMDP
jgi:tetratricopeptide (TPR) repeat protein